MSDTKSEGITPSVLITAEVKVALREFFLRDSRERMAFLHGDIDEENLVVTIRDITIPPQVSAPANVDLNQEYDPAKYFDYHDELKARHKVHPFVGQAHSFTGGGHHSPRDDNTDSLHGTEGQKAGGRTMFVAVTCSSIRARDEFRCDIVVTPPGMPQYNIVHEDVDWSFLADSKKIAEMLMGSEERVSHPTVVATKREELRPQRGKKETLKHFQDRLKVGQKKIDAAYQTTDTGGGSKN